jgi:hypothetical protein
MPNLSHMHKSFSFNYRHILIGISFNLLYMKTIAQFLFSKFSMKFSKPPFPLYLKLLLLGIFYFSFGDKKKILLIVLLILSFIGLYFSPRTYLIQTLGGLTNRAKSSKLIQKHKGISQIASPLQNQKLLLVFIYVSGREQNIKQHEPSL